METGSEEYDTREADEPADYGEPTEAAAGWEGSEQHLDLLDGTEADEGKPLLDAVVDEFHEQAHAREPGLRELLKAAVVKAGGIEGQEEERIPQTSAEKLKDPRRVQLVGLNHSVKDLDSLSRKAADYKAEGVSDEDVPARIKDAIRFTIELRHDEYSAGAWKAIDTLLSQGHEQLDVKNLWQDEVYRGVNTFWQDVESGMKFEVQFHTEFSYKVKQKTHPFYSEQRHPDTTEERAEELRQKQNLYTRFVTPPLGAETIVSERERKRADTDGQDGKDDVMSGESGGEGGAEGGEAASDVGVEAAETTENAYVAEVPADDPEAFRSRMETPDPALYEANATPETEEERRARLAREAGAAERGLLPVQLAMRAREHKEGTS
ncbi:hypothetical protein ACFVFI_19655 [Streptomyces sp. NPDC057705]|uniref:hypothetical protein n=1 Tax=Streptomyces sp. NPDC057705 TaxID=3346222 RepID=UPI0036B74D8B